MSSTIRRQKYSRRDFLFGMLNRFRKEDYWGESTGFDPSSREADTHIRDGDFTRAAEILSRHLDKSQDNLQARQKLAYCYLRLEDLEASVREFRTILRERQQDNFTNLYLGLALAKQGRVDQAIACWREYFNINHPIIQRAVNLQISLHEVGSADSGDMVDSIEQALQEQAELNQREGNEDQSF
ncbi:MAG: tetratricopeptide repeat protein [Desulfohalobiaceae bacterium]|nr:tetratricopeptide repeat protein [Desulfohalobiaceae bacterium]